MSEQTCGAPKADGSACTSNIGLSPTNGRCAHHDPERAEQMRAVRAAGGRRNRKSNSRTVAPNDAPPAPQTLQDAVHWSSWAMRAVAIGEIDARTGHEIGYLVNAFKGALEKRDLQREIEELRAQLARADARLTRPGGVTAT